ncbi:FtsX-like permease family protein [Lacticaseibacillus daqingensis]|uniref:FtsX-like permease family protein n=1 Tax=Lacticaseibacillus daqingensis TaxID=2486014 RepID=UPI000F7A6AA9|nr:FtsX-like permease family protein [Lacticaseibacillus daqingensis]
MLRKLALGGIRARFRDYAVLFSGLVIASAVFYMFMALATNSAFLTANSPVSSTTIIFGFGEVLLIIITTVYIVYANTFLMSMRQRDYAMFMMLGAKSRKIAQLIFIETVSVGFLASVVGTLVGMGLTGVAGRILINMLHAPATHFSVFWGPAILATFGFFLAMFVVAAVINAIRLLKTPMLQLLHADTTPNRIRQKGWGLILEAVAAVILLGIGYVAMGQMMKIGLMAIGIALVTIVLGTYLLFNALLVALIDLLKRNHRFAARGLHTFTLSQLSFRIRDYTKILAVVAMLFALALGAITVGLGFQREIPERANELNAYDVVTIDAPASERAAATKLTGVMHAALYTQKVSGKTVYLNATEVNAHPLRLRVFEDNVAKLRQADAKTFAQLVQAGADTDMLVRPTDVGKGVVVLPAAQFAVQTGTTHIIRTYVVRDFIGNYDTIKTMATAQTKRFKVNPMMQIGQKFYYYEILNGMYSGFAFMGFFLGIAFLAMLASTLMFKILSGASYDASRYLMLQKVGVRKGLLRRSIRQEIGALFFFPGLLGVVHVLFGLKMFDSLLAHPYGNLIVPFGIFLLLYAIYYGLTVWLYETIVIQKSLATD